MPKAHPEIAATRISGAAIHQRLRKLENQGLIEGSKLMRSTEGFSWYNRSLCWGLSGTVSNSQAVSFNGN
jgi:hypothetical protein